MLSSESMSMLQEGKILLRPLAECDQSALSHLANNKKVWHNLRDYIPFPYTESDALAFIDLTKQEKTKMTFAIEYNGDLCGVIGLVGQTDVYRKTAEIGYWIGGTVLVQRDWYCCRGAYHDLWS